MDVLKIAAFSDGDVGGNPAGVLVSKAHPSDGEMRRIAAAVGFSETAFAAPTAAGWRVRYFSPESEVPFCGHATIALGAALALQRGDGTFALALNQADITVEGHRRDGVISAALQSPPTRSAGADLELVADILRLFDYSDNDLDPELPPARAHGGAIDIIQGEDMGMRSLLRAEILPEPGSSIRVSGTARIIAD
ncbi:MAG: PhzF family phenazine biosynthesis isomerase [Nodosilinea sp.]